MAPDGTEGYSLEVLNALGETMAVTMVIGNSIESSVSLLRPGYTMASIIANEFAEAVNQLHRQQQHAEFTEGSSKGWEWCEVVQSAKRFAE